MRRNNILFGIAVLALAGLSTGLFVKYRGSQTALGDARAREDATHRRYEAAIDDISAIQDSLNAITFGDAKSGLHSSGLSSERRLSPTRTDEALARVAELRSGIERTRERIVELEARLQKSGTRVTGLERMVGRLKEGLAAKESMVAQLTTRVDSLSTHVTVLTATVAEKEVTLAEKEATLEERRRELGTVYYLVGSRQELLKSGAVVARGGILGLGKSLDASGQVDETQFHPMDTDAETVILIASKRARVLTPQPINSYRLEPTDSGMVLRILDSHQFRKVRHLVVVTA